jgi:hypothetical protein
MTAPGYTHRRRRARDAPASTGPGRSLRTDTRADTKAGVDPRKASALLFATREADA